MDERHVDHAVASRRAGDQAVDVGQLAAMRLDARRLQCGHRRVVARQPEHAVPCGLQLPRNGRPDEAGGSRHEYTHTDSR